MSYISSRGASFKCAFTGLFIAFRSEPNIRIHCIAAVIAVLCGVALNVSSTEWIFIAIAIGSVFTAEFFNSSIEKLVDLVSPERHEKAGIIKDIAAGAVLIAAITALIIGCIIFIPKLLQLII